MTIEQLKIDMQVAQAAREAAEAETARLREEQIKLQDAVHDNMKLQQTSRREESAAASRYHKAEFDLNELVAREVAESFGGCNREALLARVRAALRSTIPFEESVLKELEYGSVIRKGMVAHDLVRVGVMHKDRARSLSDAQRSRVMDVLETFCPKHPDTGRWLPPYVRE